MKNDKLLETIVRSQASNAYYRTAEQAEYDNRNLDEIAEIVKRDAEVVRCYECEHYRPAVMARDTGICVAKCRDELTEFNDFCSSGKRKVEK